MEAHWLDLLNSDWHDHLGSGRAEDRLDNQQWLAKFLGRWGGTSSRIWSFNASTQLRELRTLIRKMVDTARVGRRASAGEWDALNAYLAKSPVVRQLEKKADSYRINLQPLTSGLETILAEIALSFAEVFVDGDPSRIKICENDDCRWVFYDRSKNRSRRWCEGAGGCGNLMKVRRFRKRKKQSGS
jgi:predicted RNA-binding Zn ribbon-like protein